MKRKKILLIIAFVLLVLAGYLFYQKKMSATKVAIVNYPDFLLTKMVKSNTNKFIKTKSFKPENLPSLKSYDMILVFGMGLKLPAEDLSVLEEAGKSGVKIYLQASTNPRLKLTNLEGKQLDIVSDYIDNGGKSNYRNLLNYIRNEIDKKSFFTDTVAPPRNIPSDVLFYKEEDAVFESVEEFEKYCLEKGLHKKNAKKVGLFTSIPGPFNANRDHINALIEEFERRNINVYPVAAFRGRLDYLKKINPDLIVYIPHGRFSMGISPKVMGKWLQQQNVPVICPLSVFQRHDKWLKDKQGMFGGLLSQSVTTPELDGGILPYTVFAQYEDENGYLLFKAIPGRLKKFGQIVENYIHLRDKKNADKKVAIFYFKGPGKNALVASNMEVLPSLHNMLLHLQEKGFDLGDLPKDFESFKKDVMKKGPVLGSYAEGAFDDFIATGNPELIETAKYEDWCRKTFPAENYAEVEKKYGKAPGTYMSVYKDTTDYLAVARVQYGNVVLLPQPLPAIGDDQFQLVHGAKVAPIHSYISPYLWVQNDFNADAIMHFGTHGSLEFTPGKQIALSDYDWTDPMIGTIPHYYIYTISNVGEGMIAKRRSYAVTQTYLTPPFIEAQALGEQESLHQKIHKYDQVSGALKQEYALSIKRAAVKQGIHKDLGLDSIITKPYSEKDIMKLSNYLEEIDHEKITGGLYTMGVPYDNEHLNSTVLMMLINSLSYDLAEIDIQKGLINRKKIEDKRFYNKKYTHPCEKKINRIIHGTSSEKIFKEVVADADFARAMRWKKKNEDKPRRRMGMSAAHKASKSANDSLVTDAEIKNLKKLIITVMPQKEKREYLEKLESDKSYERAISMLDPNRRASAKKMAKMIPAMAKAIKIAEDSTVMEIIKLVKKDSLRTLALSFLQDKNLEKEVELERMRQDSALVATCLSTDNYVILKKSKEAVKDIQYSQIDAYHRLLDFFNDKKDRILSVLKNQTDKKSKALYQFIKDDFDTYKKAVDKQIMKLETREAIFSRAVFKVQKTLNDVIKKKEELRNSPKKELEAVVNSLSGGFTAPTSGGDPVSNPTTVPTGRNLYSVNEEKTPSKESWKVGKRLAESLIEDFKSKHGNAYPKKISFTLWSSSFIETEGTTIAQIFYFLGVEPVWGPFGRVRDVRVIPMKDLKRPRIDVVVQTSGQLRDLAASRLFLINKAIARVATIDEKEEDNYIVSNLKVSEKSLIDKGFSPQEARNLSKQRVFGGVNGNYGTAIMGMVESSDRWDSTQMVAQTYIKNMGAVYGAQENWGDYQKGAFEAALINTEAVVQPRQSNTWGPLSLDHVYEFMGGLNLAIKEVTGNDAESYFNDFRNSSNPRVQGLKEAIWVESRTTLFNPRYIKELTKGGASSAETFAETFRNTFGWNVMKPSVIEDRLWDKLYKVYVEDELDLNLHQFFERENPYALQEMTAVMLETVRKGMWKARPEQIEKMAQLHAKLVKKHEAGCSGFVCDNMKLKNFISEKIDEELKEEYQKEISKVRESTKVKKDNVVLKKQQTESQQKQRVNAIFTADKMVIVAIILVIILLIFVFIRKRRKNN